MRILVIDTCLQQCAVGLLNLETHELRSNIDPIEKGQAQKLAAQVEDLLQEAGITADDLCAVGVTNGPGGFTGLRVGLAFARAFVIGRDIPVFGMTSLEALAASTILQAKPKEGQKIATLIDGRRQRIFAQVFEYSAVGYSMVTEAADLEYATCLDLLQEHQPDIYAGNGLRVLQEKQDATIADTPILEQVNLQALAGYTAGRWADNPYADEKPEAVYLREADAIAAKPQIRLAP